MRKFISFIAVFIALMALVLLPYARAGNPLTAPLFYAETSGGAPLAGGLVYTFEPDSTTPKTAYTDRILTNPATNPIVLDANGQAVFYLGGIYKINLKNSAGVQQPNYPRDYVQGVYQTGDSVVKFYVDVANVDQGAAGNGLSVKDIVDANGDVKLATMVFSRSTDTTNTDYVFSTSETITANFTVEIEKGARFDRDAAKTVTFAGGPLQIIARPTQEIFTGDGATAFTIGGPLPIDYFKENDSGVTTMTSAIQEAVDSLPSGTVLMNEAIYLADAVTWDSDIYLTGQGREKSIWRQKTDGVTLFTATEKNNIRIEGVEFDGDNIGIEADATGWAGENRAIELTECTNVWIEHNYIHKFSNQAIYVNVGDGTPATKNIYIQHNEFDDIGARGVAVGPTGGTAGAWIIISVGKATGMSNGLASHVYIRDNNIHDGGQTMVSVTGSDYVYTENNEVWGGDTNAIQYGTYARFGFIRNNYIHSLEDTRAAGTEGRGVSVHDTGNENDFEISGNRIDDAQLYGIDGRCPRTRIFDNKITNTGQTQAQASAAGIYVGGDNADDVEVFDNQVHNSYARGIYVLAGNTSTISRTRIINNKVTDSGDIQINAAYTGGGVLEHTVISENQVYNGAKAGIALGRDPDFLISNNTVIDNDTSGAGQKGITIFTSGARGMVIGNTVSGAGHDYGLSVAAGCIVWAQDNDLGGNAAAITGDINMIHKGDDADDTYTLIERDVMLGWWFTNKADTDTLTLPLPAALPGMKVGFFARVDQDIYVDPNGTEVIMGGGAGKYLSLDTQYDSAFLECFVAGRWEITTSYGTLAYE